MRRPRGTERGDDNRREIQGYTSVNKLLREMGRLLKLHRRSSAFPLPLPEKPAFNDSSLDRTETGSGQKTNLKKMANWDGLDRTLKGGAGMCAGEC